MTDRIKGLIVSFEKDIRDDDVEHLKRAICQFRGVIEVTTKVVDSDDWINRERIRQEYREKILNVLKK